MYNGFADGLARAGKVEPMALAPKRPDVTTLCPQSMTFAPAHQKKVPWKGKSYGESPIAGWFLSWKLHLWMITFGVHSRKLHMIDWSSAAGPSEMQSFDHPANFIWLVVWMPFLAFSHILGMSSSQLTFIFFRGVQTTNQNCIHNIQDGAPKVAKLPYKWLNGRYNYS